MAEDTGPAPDDPDIRQTQFPGASAGGGGSNPADDSLDLSLRLLTALVIIALMGSVSLLAYRWIAPRLARDDNGPVVRSPSPQAAPAVNPAQGPVKGDEVLMDPGHVFRCEVQGRVTFSDQTCPGGATAAPGGNAPPARPAPTAPGR